MTLEEYQSYSHELERYADLIDFNIYDEGGIHSLAINLDNTQANVRDIRVKLTLQKAQALVRDAYYCINQEEPEVACEMLGLAQYWLCKAAPTLE